MLQRVDIQGIQMPRLYIAENRADVEKARANGIPYIKWNNGVEALVRVLLRPTLEKMFPHIAWSQILGPKRNVKTIVHATEGSICEANHESNVAAYDKDKMLAAQLEHSKDSIREAEARFKEHDDGEDIELETFIADGYRDIPSDSSEIGYDAVYQDIPVSVYAQDIGANVDIEALQKLGLMPKFLGDVADCIKTNLSNSMSWTEGYTKKLGVPLGNFRSKIPLPNLIILDISASIPTGIAATMVTLIETLRAQCEAELIITSARSGYYPAHSELPNSQTIFEYYGRSNEGAEFMAILDQYIAGREFGHVISFGDNDNPGRAMHWMRGDREFAPNLMNTKIHAVHHYHTTSLRETGYALWCKQCSPDAEVTFDTSWCKVMK